MWPRTEEETCGQWVKVTHIQIRSRRITRIKGAFRINRTSIYMSGLKVREEVLRFGSVVFRSNLVKELVHLSHLFARGNYRRRGLLYELFLYFMDKP